MMNPLVLVRGDDGGIGCVCFVRRLDSDVWPDGVERLNNTLLFLRPLQRNDSGVYRCEVANSIDLRSRDLRILIQGESPQTTPTPTSVRPCPLWRTAH